MYCMLTNYVATNKQKQTNTLYSSHTQSRQWISIYKRREKMYLFLPGCAGSACLVNIKGHLQFCQEHYSQKKIKKKKIMFIFSVIYIWQFGSVPNVFKWIHKWKMGGWENSDKTADIGLVRHSMKGCVAGRCSATVSQLDACKGTSWLIVQPGLCDLTELLRFLHLI